MIRLGIVLYEGFDDLDAVAPWEVLRNATKLGAPFSTTLFTMGEGTAVESSHGLRLTADRVGPPPEGLDWLLVPGGSWAARSPRGCWGEIQRGTLPGALRALYAAGSLSVASVCTGAMLLSAAGITHGRPCTTHHVAKDALGDEGALVIDARVVDDGDLVTCGGVTSGLDLALWLTERLSTRDVALRVESVMEYSRVGDVHHGPRSLTRVPAPAA